MGIALNESARRRRRLWASLASVLWLGCSGPASDVDGGAPPDAPAQPDSGDADGDGDGVPTPLDCDDADVDVGRSGVSECTSACGAGTRTCTDGVWTECEPSTDCSCESPGESRTVACGNCGLAPQRCGDDGTWEMPGECLSEGECSPADVETDASMCGERARICDDACNWREWETRIEPGECEPGDMDTVTEGCLSGQARDRTCSDACEWELSSDCEFTCTTPPALSLSGGDPVCVPDGPFVLGSLESPNTRPVRTVFLSEFHIDRYPVSKARYDMCLSVGSCPTPARTDFYARATDGQAPLGIDHAGAVAFCRWDGGRLPTEFEWEKAARGPAPDERRNSWGDFDGGCTHHPWTGCEEEMITLASYTDAVSPYGARLMGTAPEMTATRYRSNYSWISDGERDPGQPGPASLYPDYTRRTLNWWIGGPEPTVSHSSATTRTSPSAPNAMFRCVY